MIRILFKKLIINLFYYTAFWRWRLSALGSNALLILMYHRVLTKNDLDSKLVEDGIYVEREVFEKQVAFLKKHFRIINFRDLSNIKDTTRRSGKPLCIITFDDGWVDNYQNAFEILKNNQVTATIFLCTDFIGTERRFWFDILYRMILQNAQSQNFFIELRNAFKKVNVTFPEYLNISSEKDEKEFAKQCLSLAKEVEGKELLSIVDELEKKFKLSRQDRTVLNDSEIREMLKDGVEFGSHGHQHLILNKLSNDDARFDISRSKQILEERLGVKPLAFAYPNGGYSSEVVEMVRDSGFQFAVTTQPGINQFDSQAHLLKRIDIHHLIGSDLPSFIFRLLVR